MKLTDLILAVKEKNLSKDQLENYRDEMSHLFAEMQLELAEIEKLEALFMSDENWSSYEKEVPIIRRKTQWKAKPQGQREIVLKRYCLATKELLNSLRSRLYSVY